jgi:hypothetical protein
MGYVALVVHAALIINNGTDTDAIVEELKKLVFFCRHMKGLTVTTQCFYFSKDLVPPREGVCSHCA